MRNDDFSPNKHSYLETKPNLSYAEETVQVNLVN